MITLSKENLLELAKYIDEIPTKYGLPLIQFLETLKREQATPVAEDTSFEEVEEVKPVKKTKKSS